MSTERPRRREFSGRAVLPAALGLWCALVGIAQADLIKLNSGGELRGKLVKSRTNREVVTLETLSGAFITVNRSDARFVTMRPVTVEEYETRARKTPETLEAQLELAEWCKKHHLLKQREAHLLIIVNLDPNQENAQRALGRVRHNGEWIDRDDMMEQQGYVKFKGKYITPQELEVVEKTAAERESEREWSRKVKLWTNWATGANFASLDKQRDGWRALEAIDSPDAAPAVFSQLSKQEHRELRLLGVKILSRVGGPKPIPGLVKLSLMDADHEVRYQAMQGFQEDQHKRALPLYVKALRSDFNPVVCRAGAALGVVGDAEAVPALIDALITPHNYQMRVPGTSSPAYSFSTDGRMASGASLPPEIEAGLRTGQYPNGVVVLDGSPNGMLSKTRLVTVTVEHQNSEVLTALQKITGQNFGYDKRTWHLWWAAEKNQGVKGPLKS